MMNLNIVRTSVPISDGIDTNTCHHHGTRIRIFIIAVFVTIMQGV